MRLISFDNLGIIGFCVSFWYYMYGIIMGTFNVYVRLGGVFGSLVWIKFGN